jgi:hypothetical protein
MNFRIISPGKALLIILFDLIVCISVWAQSPDKLTYQAVIRNSSGGLVQKQAVNIRISILQGSSGGNSVYEEIQKATTNANGLVTLEFGGGAKWDKIDWAKGPFYIKTETDPTGGNNLSISGTSQLVSVPYALYAKTAGKVNEKDSIFKTSAAGTIIYDDLKNWSNAYNWGDHSKAGYIKSFTETDPLFMASPAKAISSANITNWSKAYSWGNHADAGYLTSATESDPIFNLSAAKGITTGNISNWTTAYGWGNHAAAGYLKSETEPLFTASAAKGITSGNIADWSTAFSWGNHAGLYKPIGYLPAWSEITSNPFKFTNSQADQLVKFNGVTGKWENWTPTFLTSESDPSWTAASGNYYTKLKMQTSGAAQLHFDNLTNKPGTLAGYGITDGALYNHSHLLNDLSNVRIQNDKVSDGQVLQWMDVAGKWVNRSLKDAGIQAAGNYLTTNQMIRLSGDVTGSGTTDITATLANNGVSPGSYTMVQVNSKGLVTAGGSPSTLSGYGITDALPLAGGTMTGKIITAPSTVASAGFNLPHSASPTAPVDGDVWTTSTGMFARINGITATISGNGGNYDFAFNNANGITGTIVTSSSTKTLSLALGAITPSSIVSTGDITGRQLISTVPTGTPPLVVSSTTPVANLSIGGNAGSATTSTNLTGGTSGAVPYQTSMNATAFTAPGLTGQVLTSQGTGSPIWTTPSGGTVTSVTGVGPIVSSGGNTPAISMAPATALVPGYLTTTDWTTFNNKQAALGFTPENIANKVTSLSSFSTNTEYPSAKLLYDQLALKTQANSDIVSGTKTKISYDAKGLVTAGADAQLASSDFANQGTSNTVLHGNATGNPSWSQIIDADVSVGANIADTKLGTISAAGKVANSATTATSLNNPNTIVLRDGTGNFAANTITADLVGNA